MIATAEMCNIIIIGFLDKNETHALHDVYSYFNKCTFNTQR